MCVCSGQEEYGQLKKKNKVLQGEATLYHDELEKEKNKNETLLAEVCTVLYCTVLYHMYIAYALAAVTLQALEE